MIVTILGCGSSLGVPALKYGWGKCDPNNPKNRRTRSSIKIDTPMISLLVDTSPDLLHQLQRCNNQNVDAVFFTHTHYDHVGGINELRPMFLGSDKTLQVYSTLEFIENIKRMFFYLFEQNEVDIYKGYIDLHVVQNIFQIGDLTVHCFKQDHGFSSSLGIRINDFAYSTDIANLSNDNIQQLKGVKVWIVDCLTSEQKRPTHACLPDIIEWSEKIRAEKIFLTHMDSSMDYDALMATLPKHIRPAYDQMQIEVN